MSGAGTALRGGFQGTEFAHPPFATQSDYRLRAVLKVICTTRAGSITLQPPRLFQTSSHFRVGAIETNSECGTGRERSLGSTSRNGANGRACNASSIASILMQTKNIPRLLGSSRIFYFLVSYCPAWAWSQS